MAWAIDGPNGTYEIMPGGQIIGADGTHYTWNVVDLWSQADLAAAGINPIVEPVVPADQMIVSSVLIKQGGQVVRGNVVFGLVPPPDSITRIQFWMALAANGDITQAEALAYATSNTIPAKVVTALANLSAAQQYKAKMQIFSSPYKRNGTLATAMQNLLGKSDADMDAIWRAGAKIT